MTILAAKRRGHRTAREKLGVRSPGRAPAQDLRVSQRIPIGMSVKAEPWTARGVRDHAKVTNRGVCFVSTKPCKVNEEVRVELYIGPNGSWVRCPAGLRGLSARARRGSTVLPGASK